MQEHIPKKIAEDQLNALLIMTKEWNKNPVLDQFSAFLENQMLIEKKEIFDALDWFRKHQIWYPIQIDTNKMKKQ
jgi:hypothetical protein